MMTIEQIEKDLAETDLFMPVAWQDTDGAPFLVVTEEGSRCGLEGGKVVVGIWRAKDGSLRMAGMAPPDDGPVLPRTFKAPASIPVPRQPMKLSHAIWWAATEVVFAYRRAGLPEYAGNPIYCGEEVGNVSRFLLPRCQTVRYRS